MIPNHVDKMDSGGVTGICASQGYIFPAQISLGMCVSPHAYHQSNNWLQVTVICVSQGNVFPLKVR